LTSRRAFDPQFDLFVPFIADLPLRDQRETMERPFFSLAKRKRLKPIEYVSPNGDLFVNVFPNAEFGMATIWDADILIWAASALNNLRKQGVNDLPRTLSFQPYDVLKTICRDTGGQEYRRLREGLGRLQATTIVTNIRVKKGKKQRQFSWVESWTDLVDDETGQSRGMTLTLSDWFYEGILMDGGLLAIDPTYFSITGGRERWLYRVARKHAGGAGEDGFAIPLPTLFEKSGAEGTYRRFKFEMLGIIRGNELPGFDLGLELKAGEPALRMTRRELVEGQTHAPRKGREGKARIPPPVAAAPLPLFRERTLADETIARVRRDFPGWDIYALKSEFDLWLDSKNDRDPRDYQAAFYGFVRQFHKREGR
jgi:plasmid replication initiation protein